MSVAGLEVVYLMLLSFVKLMMVNRYKIGINVFLTLFLATLQIGGFSADKGKGNYPENVKCYGTMGKRSFKKFKGKGSCNTKSQGKRRYI